MGSGGRARDPRREPETGTADIISEAPFEALRDLRATPGVAIHEPKSSSALAGS